MTAAVESPLERARRGLRNVERINARYGAESRITPERLAVVREHVARLEREHTEAKVGNTLATSAAAPAEAAPKDGYALAHNRPFILDRPRPDPRAPAGGRVERLPVPVALSVGLVVPPDLHESRTGRPLGYVPAPARVVGRDPVDCPTWPAWLLEHATGERVFVPGSAQEAAGGQSAPIPITTATEGRTYEPDPSH